MKPVNIEYKNEMPHLDNENEFNLINDYLNELKNNEQVECIYMNYDQHYSRHGYKFGIDFYVIAQGDLGKLKERNKDFEIDLFWKKNNFNYDYKFFISSLDNILYPDSDYAKIHFRIHLTNFDSRILFDRHGFFTAMYDEIMKKAGPTKAIHFYENLGELDIEKEVSKVFHK